MGKRSGSQSSRARSTSTPKIPQPDWTQWQGQWWWFDSKKAAGFWRLRQEWDPKEWAKDQKALLKGPQLSPEERRAALEKS